MTGWNQETARGDATERYDLLLQLDPKQAKALEVLAAGGSHEAAAEAAGVHRVTVTRWANHHPEFVAEMNRRRLDAVETGINEECLDRFMGMDPNEYCGGTAKVPSASYVVFFTSR